MSGVLGQRSGGHNRKSSEAHALAGTLRRDRHALGLPVAGLGGAIAKVPRAPAGLSADSRRLWARIHAEYALTSAPSLELLESALRSRDLAEQARRTLDADGLTYADKAGQPKAHPAAAIQRDARAAFVTTMRILGFPSEER